ncbi:MAG: DUF2812 domain-containing protein [Anaerovorax sp.]|nr:DUF2812 domain-containing protein [Anaerovorax sp.]
MLENQKRKKKYCWRFWPFFKQDYKYIAPYLEEREKKGYRFCSLGCFLPVAQYQKVEPQEARYDVDVFRPKQYIEIQPYLDVCEDSGWKICWQWDEYKIFRALDGKNPIPLQTDWEIKREQEQRIRKKDLRNSILMFLYFLVLFLLGYKIEDNVAYLWTQFYLSSYSMQAIIGIGFVCFIGSIIMLLNRIYHFYHFYSDKITESVTLNIINRTKKSATVVKILYIILIGGGWISLILGIVLGDFEWGFVGAWMVGSLIGTGVRFSLKESDWPKERKISGLHKKGYCFAVFVMILLLSIGIYFCMDARKEVFENSNFFMSYIEKNDDFYSIRYRSGTCKMQARTKQTADRMWVMIDREIRCTKPSYTVQYEEKEMKLPLYRALNDTEIKKYGEYEKGIYYPLRARILLRNANEICVLSDELL